MFKKLFINLALFIFAFPAFAQYTPKWNETFGNKGDQVAESLIEVSDGNFLFVGHSKHIDFTSKLYITKFRNDGSEIWHNYIGVDKYQFGHSVIEMPNGDFFVTGKSNYNSHGDHDLWLVRIDREGEKIWEHSFGGKYEDEGNSIINTSDGGFIIAGKTYSKGNGESDIWVLKFDNYGILEWEQTYGGSESEVGNSIIETSNGDFLVTGSTISIGNGKKDIDLIRISKYGRLIWNKNFGNVGNDEGYKLLETANGDIILAGNSTSDEYKVPRSFIVRTNENGNELWKTYFGEPKRSSAFSLVEMPNGNIAVAGFTHSITTGYDVQVSLINEYGETNWNQIYGGLKWDEAKDIVMTSDYNLLLTGYTKSYNSDGCDVWTLMLEPDITPEFIESPEITPYAQIFSDVDTNIPSSNNNGINTLAVIIGIEKHKYVLDAKFAEHDAAIFYKYTKSVLGLPDRNILYLTNENATSAEFSKAFNEGGWLDKRADENTEIIVYYAGHALPEANPDIDEVYLMPYDVDSHYANMLGMGMGINRLVNNLGNLSVRSTTLFIDACFSSISKQYAHRPIINKDIVYNSNVNIMFASDENETAIPYQEKHHGLFTYFLLKGMQGAAKGNDNKITFQELYKYVRGNVSKEAGFLDEKQTPQMIAVDKNFKFIEF